MKNNLWVQVAIGVFVGGFLLMIVWGIWDWLERDQAARRAKKARQWVEQQVRREQRRIDEKRERELERIVAEQDGARRFLVCQS